MDLLGAIRSRHSVRAYKDMPLAEEAVVMLRKEVERINREGGLHCQLVVEEPKAYQNFFAKYGKFTNVRNYIVMAGKKAEDLDERIGYYGEQVVLRAQMMGVNSCWCGLSYSKVPGTYQLNEGEVIRAYISIGYGVKEGTGHKIKNLEQVSNANEQSPDWFFKGVDAALLAPTAVNQQKFFFEYMGSKEGEKPKVRAKRAFSMVGFTKMDLGIVKYHFEVGAGKENFDWE